MSQGHARFARGFTVTEMLFTLAIMGVSAILVTRLFTGSMHVINSAPQSQNHFAAIDRMSASVRRDTWGATNIAAPDTQTLVLSQSNGGKVTWHFAGDSVSRSDSEGEQHWPMDVSLSAAREGSQVVLKSRTNDELRFTSQMLAMNGGGK